VSCQRVEFTKGAYTDPVIQRLVIWFSDGFPMLVENEWPVLLAAAFPAVSARVDATEGGHCLTSPAIFATLRFLPAEPGS